MLTKTILAISACAVTGLILTGLNRDHHTRSGASRKPTKEEQGEALFI